MIPSRCGGASWSKERKKAYRTKKAEAEQKLQEILATWARDKKGDCRK